MNTGDIHRFQLRKYEKSPVFYGLLPLGNGDEHFTKFADTLHTTTRWLNPEKKLQIDHWSQIDHWVQQPLICSYLKPKKCQTLNTDPQNHQRWASVDPKLQVKCMTQMSTREDVFPLTWMWNLGRSEDRRFDRHDDDDGGFGEARSASDTPAIWGN